jgi:DNA repair protein RadC
MTARCTTRQAHLWTPLPDELLQLARQNLALLTELATHYEVARLGPPSPLRTLSRPQEVVDYLGHELVDLAQEQLRVLSLDTRNHVLCATLVYQGGVSSIPIRIADCFREAVRLGAVSVILCHNHPGGDATPSPEDVAMTADAVQAGKLLGITVLDHVIVSSNGHVSLAERKLLPHAA